MTEAYARIAELLSLTYSSPEDSTRKSAEQELSHYSQDSTSMIKTLLQLTAEPLDANLRTAAATKLRHLIRSLIEGSSLSSQHKCDISEAVFKVMVLPLSKNLRTILSYSLSSLLVEDPTALVSTKLSLLCTQCLKGSVYEVQASLVGIKALFSNLHGEFSTKDLFYKLLPVLSNLGVNAYTQFTEAFSSQNADSLLLALQILTAWAETLSQVLEHFEMISPKILKGFLSQVDIVGLFGSIICFKPRDDRILVSGPHQSWSGNGATQGARAALHQHPHAVHPGLQEKTTGGTGTGDHHPDRHGPAGLPLHQRDHRHHRASSDQSHAP